MDTKTNSRIQKLEFLLKQMDKIHLRDAAEILNVSEMTIRRDLGTEPGSLVLLGGYIVKDPQHLNENSYFILEQQNKNIVQKMQIGKLAAEQIKEGDVVFFDCGSTIPFIASQISDSLQFTALCCSINTFMVLQEKRQCNLILCGAVKLPTHAARALAITRLKKHGWSATVLFQAAWPLWARRSKLCKSRPS